MSETDAREENNKLGEPAELPAELGAAVTRISGAERMDRLGQGVLVVEASAWGEVAGQLRDAGFESLVDLCGVDYQGYEAGSAKGTRFEVVVNLLSYSHGARLRVRVAVDGESPSCPSVCGTWPGANWFERETFDMFGIDFTGHPELTRILMPDDWSGHPLKKDFVVGAIPVQFSGAPRPQ